MPGESMLATAVREVGEEIGAEVAVTRKLSDVSYRIDTGRKTVSFWAMRYLRESGEPDDEVDKVEWLPPKAARKLLTYDLERRVLAEFAALPPPDAVLILVRHARAGKRSEWRGDDYERPLDLSGERQAQRLVPFLRAFAPERVYAAEPKRCVQTVEPFADSLGVPVKTRPEFSDACYSDAPDESETAIRALAKPGRVSVVCSQGQTIPGVIDRLVPGVASTETRKGSAWVLSFVDGTVVSADYYDDPF